MIGKEWCFSATSVYIYDSGSIVLTGFLEEEGKHATGCRPLLSSGSLTSIRDMPCAFLSLIGRIKLEVLFIFAIQG